MFFKHGNGCGSALSGRMLVLALAASGFALACADEAPPEARVIVRPVKTLVFGESETTARYEYPGRVYANRTVEVAFEVSGKLAKLPVTKGQDVEKGDLLGQLDQRDFRNELAASQAVLDNARSTLARFEKAAAARALPIVQVDEQRAATRVAEADVRIKRKQLADTTIRADFDGIVSDRFYDNFQNVAARQPVLNLQDISVLEIRMNIPESDVAGPADAPVGHLSAFFEQIPGREFPLELKEFVTEADPVTQTFPITLMMRNPEDVDVLPGMTATVRWEREWTASLAPNTVPAGAVLGQAGRRPWVWVVDPETRRVSKREVEVGGLIARDQLEISSGLEAGETIAIAGVHHLSEGLEVREYR